jgi:hypothetical protein
MCDTCQAFISPNRLASIALDAYLTGRWTIAASYLNFTQKALGRDGIRQMAMNWCRTVIGRCPGMTIGNPTHLTWADIETGEKITAEDAPLVVRWAGRMLSASAAGDDAMSRALVEALPHDHLAVVEHMAALLHVLAVQLHLHTESHSAGWR